MINPGQSDASFLPIRPSGPRLILSNAHLLSSEGNAQIEAGATSMTVDLAEIEFIDSSGIGALVGLRKRLADGQLRLINTGGFVATVLKKTKTDVLFQVT